MTPTVWFLVMLFLGDGHFVLDIANMPEEFPTQLECSQAGMDKMADASIQLFCIEADDGLDLRKILMKNFDFGQDRGDPI